MELGNRDSQRYAFTNALDGQQDRLRTLGAVLDAGSRRHLSAAGVTTGWRCLEVGTGGGSMAAWLAEQVGPTGEVLATDLDTSRAKADYARPGLVFQDADLLVDELPQSHFDLAHARLVIDWLPQPQSALRRLSAAVKEGGWVVIESFDWMTLTAATGSDPDLQLFKRVLDVHLDVVKGSNGYDYEYGRRLPAELQAVGLSDIDVVAEATLWRGGGNGMLLWRLTFTQLRDPIIAAGVSSDELDQVLAMCDDPSIAFIGPLMVTAKGRRASS